MVAGICTLAAVLLATAPQYPEAVKAATAPTTTVAAATDPARAAQLSQEGWQAWQRQQFEPGELRAEPHAVDDLVVG